MGVRGVEVLSDAPQRRQTVMLEIACETIEPAIIAELLTRGGFVVLSVEAERGGEWILKPGP